MVKTSGEEIELATRLEDAYWRYTAITGASERARQDDIEEFGPLLRGTWHDGKFVVGYDSTDAIWFMSVVASVKPNVARHFLEKYLR
jgi:hypothetical protein|nr:hypothetical protein [Neorhizobium tomejilense]